MEQPTGLIDRCAELCRRRERPDLVQRLATTRARWKTSDVRVLVIGEFKQGKSQLVNALVGAPLCPVHDDIATSVPLTVRYAASPEAAVLRTPSSGTFDEEPRRESVEISSLAGRLSAPGRDQPLAAEDGSRVVGGEAGLPRRLLQDGLVLVDTPGVGGLGTAHGAATRAVLPSAHAVLVATDASQELTAPEVELIRQALDACPHVALVLTKTDLHPRWRHVQELNQARLEAAGLRLTQLAVSSELSLRAGSTKDADLLAESGFPALTRFLRTSLLARREELARSSVRHDVDAVLTDLAGSLDSEHRVLSDPDHLPTVLAELAQARKRAEDLKKRSARWQQTLADGVADLNSDLDHDLRDRMRVVQAAAEQVIDDGDPGHDWDAFVAWLEESTAGALADTFAWADQSAAWLVDKVATHFEEGSAESLPRTPIADIGGLGERVRPLGQIDTSTPGLGGKALIGLKGSYGGVLMFGILTGLAGMTLINPISVGAGLLLGGRAFRDDAEGRLARRRSEARTLVRRHLDEVVFQTAKVLRDRLRMVQRQVRDHFTEVADDLARSIAESVTSAQGAAKADAREREGRLATVAGDRATLKRLRAEAQALGTGPEGRRSAPRQPAARGPAPAVDRPAPGLVSP